jgi:hypothetical protein
MTTEEILQLCALNGISIIFRRTNPELVGATIPLGLPEGAESVLDVLRIPDMVELIFSIDTPDGRVQLHTVIEPGLVRDAGAFAACVPLAFEKFCRAARISPRPLHPPRTMFGFPIAEREEY